MPLRKYYSEYHLRNSGEKVVAQMLAHSLNYFREQWFMVHSWLRSGHLKDTAGECDFIIIGQKGLLVLEVKGSQWKLEQNRFFQTRHKEWEERENPFQQARNNKAAVIEILGKRGINHVLVTSAAIFPECSFPLDEPPDPFWHMGRRERQDLASFVVTVLDEQYEQQKEVNLLPLRVLSNNEMQEIADMLCPSVLPNEVYAHLSLSREEAKKRAVDNIRILDGLRDNERLIVQGPPGSGKSTYAMSLANRRNRQGDGKILYLCWNELLAVYNDFKFKETGNQNVLVSAYFPFIRYLKSVAGFNPDDLNFEEVDRPGGIAAHLREALDKLEEIGQLPEYDYIIVDECQDLFHRGVELIIDRLSRGRNGLIAGRFAIFFDNSQVFSVNLDRERYESAFAKLKSAAASYKIDYRYRGVAGNGLYEFIADLEQGDIDLGRYYGNDVIVRTYMDDTELWALMERTFNEIRGQAAYEERNTVLLFTSNLASGLRFKKMRLLDETLKSSDIYRPISHETLTATLPNKVKYTTALTYKGLERDIVVLVVKDFYNHQIDCIHQVLIGASRARIRLYLLIDKESVRQNADRLANGAVGT